MASQRRRPCSLGFDFMAAVVKSRGGSSPHKVLCVVCTGLARNPVKSGGDCRCGSIWSPVIRPMAAGTDDPGGLSPSELCTAYITLKCNCNCSLSCDRYVFGAEFGSDFVNRISILYIYIYVTSN